MYIDFLLDVFSNNSEQEAIVWRERTFSYQYLIERIEYWQSALVEEEIAVGSVVMVEADFSPNAIALFLALTEQRCIVVPITESVRAKREEFMQTAMVEKLICVDELDNAQFQHMNNFAEHPNYQKLRDDEVPGLVLFSSGSTGKSKAAVHDLAKLLEKFKVQRHAMRAISFLLYDHIGGVNTMLYTLANGGCLITLQQRQPDYVLRIVQDFQAQLLPTSPTFINLMLLSGACQEYNLSSLTTVTYGTEPMPESTLKRLHKLFPNIRLLQTYGLSELGILRSKSKDSSSLWMKVGGEGFDTRIVDGILQIKAHSAMLGYLNAPSPFTDDGWFHTGDMVEQDGDYIRVLGRKSEMINVGGQKVFPAEVESVLQQLPEIAEAQAYGEKNALLGNVVYAKLRLQFGIETSRSELKIKIKQHCLQQLESFKVPAKLIFDDSEQYSARFKKQRSLR